MSDLRAISPSELKARLDRGDTPCIIDVREDEEVAAGMIPGAKHIALGELPGRCQEIPKDCEVILVCRSGNRSGKAYAYLESLGYRNTVNMTGGMTAWSQL
ncbi:rhodanese-like domain-containing protein [Paenibacillus thermotolerans]|uniref:rhodanese-like domain-containing protein n=1 Tax=Paenibacillus thermotolerans TaxID=3027807 RepID=UPI0023688F50|nr:MULTISPECIES: rhodanese-like domain-containing protein [unclassified Paenibacillus]